MPEGHGIFVLAGTNGAGKSSVAGTRIRLSGGDYFNPDEATRRILAKFPRLGLDEANSRAWREGRRLLERAIQEGKTFAFETTLGGRSIPRLLSEAASAGLPVRIWYVGLANVEMHIARVRARVAYGGHDIPEATIRARYDASRANLVALLPRLAELSLFDNSAQADPARDLPPRPKLILHTVSGRADHVCPLDEVPGWAKPIVMAALK